jgi:hypothetical protein
MERAADGGTASDELLGPQGEPARSSGVRLAHVRELGVGQQGTSAMSDWLPSSMAVPNCRAARRGRC